MGDAFCYFKWASQLIPIEFLSSCQDSPQLSIVIWRYCCGCHFVVLTEIRVSYRVFTEQCSVCVEKSELGKVRWANLLWSTTLEKCDSHFGTFDSAMKRETIKYVNFNVDLNEIHPKIKFIQILQGNRLSPNHSED